jgi:DNA-binding transcriptional ArsR family regulator
MLSPSLAQEISQLEADFCFALSDPTRILMLYALNEGARNVTEIANELQITQPSASRHLKVLRERGLVQATRQGATINYQLGDMRVIQALDLLRASMRDGLARRANLVNEVGSGERV